MTYLSDIGDIVLDAQRIMKNNLDLDTDQIEKEILYQNIKLQISPLLMFYTTVEQFTKKYPNNPAIVTYNFNSLIQFKKHIDDMEQLKPIKLQ